MWCPIQLSSSMEVLPCGREGGPDDTMELCKGAFICYRYYRRLIVWCNVGNMFRIFQNIVHLAHPYRKAIVHCQHADTAQPTLSQCIRATAICKTGCMKQFLRLRKKSSLWEPANVHCICNFIHRKIFRSSRRNLVAARPSAPKIWTKANTLARKV